MSETSAPGAGHDFVRPFIMTRGRTKSTRTDLRYETLVQRVDDAPISAAVPSEQVAILRLCVEPISVAELAVALHLVIGVVTVLINDLIDSGMLAMGAEETDDVEFDVLSRIANKIRSL